ncbi:hypothetical protein SAMN05428997_14515 [Bosea sp. CRIB-10]|uniref:hypothetical protein n=1 Tax=Bosea sp. CRIB-10 TaxID=378404 RepID=UPI0008EEB79A|nr:hypothetical protein [Bosea sp. CRIB-10]SFD71914.1 hypothetical protein SAMN05428997_14515 [Bosea sp. CRIB-10]
MSETIKGIKLIDIVATTAYPIVSAYEYEFLKGEEVVRKFLKNATIYFILQRPLMFFDNLVADDGELTFDIVDGVNQPLHCKVGLSALGLPKDEEGLLKAQYYREPASKEPPFRDVAAFQIFKNDETFVAWETPQKILYEVIGNGLPVSIEGDVAPFLEYRVHYIGQAFSQRVWQRHTGHEKLQKILTLEEPLSTLTTRPALEISILMLSITGMGDNPIFPYSGFPELDGVEPIVHEFDFEDDNESFEKFYNPQLLPGAHELTNEVEAKLINLFKPEYNGTLFKEYPNIKSGTRSKGYSDSHVTIEKLPAILATDHFREAPIIFGQAPRKLGTQG